jgi:hypothetical protein
MATTRCITSPRMTVSLAVALLQGLLLNWLHTRIQAELWPATDPAWLGAMYAVGVAVPITLHLLSEHWRQASLWWALAAGAAALAFFGWHFGAEINNPASGQWIDEETAVPFALRIVLLGLLFLPFLRARLLHGRWRCEYGQLFTLAWQNVLALAEAALFTGVLWLLLFLWAQLFGMLGIDAFEELFERPAFVYPFTAVAFGVALHLMGSVERIVTVAREQLLGLLKWLLPVVALILALFAPTLLLKLPGLVFSGQHAVSAVWLLWLVSVTVLLINTGYQSGGVQPYPQRLALALRIVVPALLVISGTALYSLGIRVLEYGLTVERVFALGVAMAAAGYAVGYTFAAVRRGPWMQGIEGVNIGVAIVLMVAISLTLTPLASPQRLAARSQAVRAAGAMGDFNSRDSALKYLRFDAGRYGMRELEKLTRQAGGSGDQGLREHATRVLALATRWQREALDVDEMLARSDVFPRGRAFEPALRQALRAATRSHSSIRRGDPEVRLRALFIDLNADGIEECVVLRSSHFMVFTRSEGRWLAVATGYAEGRKGDAAIVTALAAGNYAPLPASWSDLRIGDAVLRMRAAVHQEFPDSLKAAPASPLPENR